MNDEYSNPTPALLIEEILPLEEIRVAAGRLWDVPSEQYHADVSKVSNSMLGVWRQSRQRYYRRFVAQTDPRPEPTPQMLSGTLLHWAVLEPKKFTDGVAVAPHCDRRTTIGKEAWKAFCVESAGKLVMDADAIGAVTNMRDALLRNPVARMLIEREGAVEQSLTWHDELSGLDLKARLDKVIPGQVILDLKTARDVTPIGFARAVAGLGYHRQASLYSDGWQAVTGERLPFLFVAVCSESPFDVALYELDDSAIDLGSNQNRSALQQLAACYRNDDWLNPFAKRITRLSLPKWTVYEDEYTIIE